MSRQRNKSRAGLLSFDFKTPVEFFEKNFFQETIRLIFGFDAVEFELIGNSSLKSFIHALRTTSGLRGIGRDHLNAQVPKSASYLG